MARFSAFTSDDSSSESEEEVVVRPNVVEEESEGDDESSSSEMQEDELMSSPLPSPKRKPTRNALVQDEDGEVYYAHERASGPAESMPWAQQVGVDAQKMHVMQASLFRQPEEAAAMRALNQHQHQQHRVVLNRKHSRDSDGEGLRAEPSERASFAHDIEPQPYRPSRKYARVEGSSSVITGHEGAVVDAGLFLGRSFRVGWGPGGTLVHLGALSGPQGSTKQTANSSIITKTTIPISSPSPVDQSTRAARLLQHHLSNSPIAADEDGVPFADPSRDLRFSSFVGLFAPTDRSPEASLFRLGHALFDEIELRLADSVTVDIRNRIQSVRRKAALSEWLRDAVAPTVEKDIKSNPSAATFTLLTGNQIEQACETAITAGNVKLATLIAQGPGDFEFRQDLRAQVQIWQEQRIDMHIDKNIRKIYALLGGLLEGVAGSKGTGCSDIQPADGLDWKRAFGLHLWFSEPEDATVTQVYKAYETFWKASPGSNSPPVTWYTEAQTPPELRWKLPGEENSIPDALFSLLRLHAEPACSLSRVLTPWSFGPSPADYSLPWHLYILLSRCMGVRDFSDRGDPGVERSESDDDDEDVKVEGHSPTADLLAGSYAFQLEQLGMVQEALFVLLHIEGSAGRKKAVKELLARSAGQLDDWITRGVVGSLKIPMAWVNEAKAIHAMDNGNVFEAYELYLAAGLHGPAHELAILELAPDAVIRHDLELLSSLFSKMSGQGVDGWNVRGKVLLDYARVLTRMPVLYEQIHEHDRDAVPDASQALEMEELVRTIPRLIGILPDVFRDRSDVRHNAALALMIAELIGQLDRVQPLALAPRQVQPALVDGATKLKHLHSTALQRFIKSVEVA